VLKTVAKAGGVARGGHDIAMFMNEKLRQESRVGFEHMARVSAELSLNRASA
jgi:hypothetical protein